MEKYKNDVAHNIFDVNCQLDYQVNGPSTFIMNVQAIRGWGQRIGSEDLDVDAFDDFDEYSEPETATRYNRFSLQNVQEETPLRVKYHAVVNASFHLMDPSDITGQSPNELPLDVLHYLYPSRYCQSDQVQRIAFQKFASLEPGYPQVVAICEWIQRNVEYLSGSSGAFTSAYETLVSRAGVCRDFAHLAVAFCRALNIPARFVSCYADHLPFPDFHAVFEAWLGDRWYVFDATGHTSPLHTVRVGTGRDAADVSFAFIFGPSFMTDMAVSCQSQSPNLAKEHKNKAISFG